MSVFKKRYLHCRLNKKMDEEEHSPSKFYYPDEEMDINATFRDEQEKSTGETNSQDQEQN